jgi:hypothetical protein
MFVREFRPALLIAALSGALILTGCGRQSEEEQAGPILTIKASPDGPGKGNCEVGSSGFVGFSVGPHPVKVENTLPSDLTATISDATGTALPAIVVKAGQTVTQQVDFPKEGSYTLTTLVAPGVTWRARGGEPPVTLPGQPPSRGERGHRQHQDYEPQRQPPRPQRRLPLHEGLRAARERCGC